jgi:hypothetical protein
MVDHKACLLDVWWTGAAPLAVAAAVDANACHRGVIHVFTMNTARWRSTEAVEATNWYKRGVTVIPFPPINVDAHLATAELHERLMTSPASPTDEGRVTLLCARPARHARALFERVHLNHDGMPTDRWRSGKAKPEMQLAVMEHRVAMVVANGQSLALFGDNLSLDLDLSLANLPIHSLLRVGDATVVVTPEPHTGCQHYAARFGREALRYISAPDRRDARLRGVYLRVVESGDVWLDAPVHVLRRGPVSTDENG